jgi:hypothetical protein
LIGSIFMWGTLLQVSLAYQYHQSAGLDFDLSVRRSAHSKC